MNENHVKTAIYIHVYMIIYLFISKRRGNRERKEKVRKENLNVREYLCRAQHVAPQT